MPELDVVTGAFSYTGRYIARRLLEAGRRVRTLTNHPRPELLPAPVEVAPLSFQDPSALTEVMRGAQTLYNTYWVRLERDDVTFERAVANSTVLVEAAREAGVGRIVHISVTNPSLDSPFPYFRGKAEVERVIERSGIGYAIVRPTLVFGREDILLNNIAWILRRLPIFGTPGRGDYRLRPVFVDDVARLCLDAARSEDNLVFDAVGSETYSFKGLIRALADAIGKRVVVFPVPPPAALLFATGLGLVVGDVLMTRHEMEGLLAELIMSDAPTNAPTRLSEWLREHGSSLGSDYASELGRHYRAR